MRDKVVKWIEERELLGFGDRVIVALSGGADSVTLLHVLISIKELYNLQIYALHFNHKIRGEEADRDERFCADLCSGLGVEYSVIKDDVPARATQTGESLELCGRRMRYEALERYSSELGGAKIATAHNLNDNTETVLLNLIRGTGLAGLAGIPAKRGDIIRPLLSCSRDEIEAYCRENALSCVTDSTNLCDEYTRNKLRLNILPELRRMNPALDEGVARTAAVMRDADEYLDKNSLKELNKCKTEYGYSCERLLMLDGALLGYAVKNILEEAGAPVDSRHIELIIEKMADGGSVDLGRGFRAVCAQGTLRITGTQNADESDTVMPVAGFARKRVSAGSLADELEEYKKRFGKSENAERIHNLFFQNCIPCDIITNDVVVRRRRAGDTFTDPGRCVTKTLKKLFNELKIPREKRGEVTVIARGSTVLWIQGIGASKQALIPEGYTGDVWILI